MYLLSVLSPGGVKALDEVCGVAKEHGVAGSATDKINIIRSVMYVISFLYHMRFSKNKLI